MNSYITQCLLSFSYPRLQGLSTPKTWACLQWVKKNCVCNDPMLLVFFYTRTWPSTDVEKYDCSFHCDKSQVCTCGLSHTVLSQLVKKKKNSPCFGRLNVVKNEGCHTGWQFYLWMTWVRVKKLRKVFIHLFLLIVHTTHILDDSSQEKKQFIRKGV